VERHGPYRVDDDGSRRCDAMKSQRMTCVDVPAEGGDCSAVLNNEDCSTVRWR
jgi:hypothetical protein